MKKNLILLVSAILISVLFYEQSLGLNCVLFSNLAAIIVFMIRPDARRKDVLFFALLFILSGIFTFAVHSSLSVALFACTLLLFMGSISGFRNAVYVRWLNGIYQVLFGSLHAQIHGTKTSSKESKNSRWFVLLCLSIVITITLLFASLYGASNPIFKSWLDAIDLSFLNISWLLFTTLSFIFLKNITAEANLELLTKADREAPLFLKAPKTDPQKTAISKKEAVIGSVLLGTLNGLIFLYIVSDLIYISKIASFEAPQLSATVHEGVRALILSILIAISVIVILFRGRLNFIPSNRYLRPLAFTWIGLNAVILLSTAYKNHWYVTEFGLTYKRLGVFIYLLLCISGLVTTFLKVRKKQNFLYLIKTNSWVVYAILIAMSSFHWDRAITNYNLSRMDDPHLEYLLSLGPDNGDLLFAYAKAKSVSEENRKAIRQNYKMWRKKHQKKTWQSSTLSSLQLSLNTKPSQTSGQ